MIIENCSFVNNIFNVVNEIEVYIKGIIFVGGGVGFMYYNVENFFVIINNLLFEFNIVVMNDIDYFIVFFYNVLDFIYVGGGMIVFF